MAKQTKTVLGQMIGLAVRHDALLQNPVRETSPISTRPKNPPRALTVPQAAQLMAMLDDTPANVFPERIHIQSLPRYCTVGALVRLVDHLRGHLREQDA